MSEHDEGAFYGVDILRHDEEKKVRQILKQFDGEPVGDELKKKIWDALQDAKYRGEIKIPFKVVMRRDYTHKYPEYVEVILDTKL